MQNPRSRTAALLVIAAAMAACSSDSTGTLTETFSANNVAVANWIDTNGRCAPDQTLHIQGIGDSNLGEITIEQSHCFNAQGANPLAFHDGRFTNTFSDGGAFAGTYQGSSVPTANPAVFGITAQWEITSGSGSYAAASGAGAAAGQANIQTGAGTITLTGTITRK